MASERRAGPPRLIDWTGERCVPWAPDVQVVYEHYHRYLWAARLVDGMRVLDLGSGEGFGAALLARRAAHVTGLDVDPDTVRHSRLNYVSPNLEFREGSVLELEATFDAGSFDAVVAFETIEHVADHERVLAGVRHVLAPEGLLVVSTPDRRVYSEQSGTENPFHERELSEPELRELLGSFASVRLFGQRAVAGSSIAALEADEAPAVRPFALRREDETWVEADEPSPLYLVALASDGALPAVPARSTLSDYELTLLHEQRGRAELAQRDAAAARQEADDARQEADTARQEADDARRASERAQAARAEAEQALRAAEERVEEHLHELEDDRDRIVAQRHRIEDLEATIARDAEELGRVRASVVWQTFQRARGKLFGLLGEDTRRTRSLQWLLRTAGRAVGTTSAPKEEPARFAPIHLPTFQQPVVSLVVTAYTGAEITAACLRSIAEHTIGPAYEVIVVDDAGDEDNACLWEAVHGARVLVNRPGIGYLRSVNRGAAEARGRFIVLMNNDVEVQPGWLPALVAHAESAPDVGAVAAKLVYPDGKLQEAGGIVFDDGSAWNFGNGDDPAFHEFEYVREVDYGSAACLLVRTDAWRRVGGYDERFLPMYYEDVDLCFALRNAGLRVMYEPTARVVHHEGGTAGTDLDSGAKRHQELNRPKLVEKWRAQLERQPAPRTTCLRSASTRARGPHVLVVDHRVPMPDHDAGSLRMQRLVETLLELGCRVTFAADDMSAHQPYTRDLQTLGVDVIHGQTWMSRELAAMDDVQLAIVSRPYVAAQHMHLLREHAPDTVIAYDTVDLHYVRERRRAEVGAPHALKKSATIRELELALVRGGDATIVVSEEEREELEREVPGAHVVVIPVVNEIADVVPPREGRSGVLFVGGFEHPPNVDAALTLVRDVMPRVWAELGDVPVTIAGSKPPAEVEALAGPGVEVTGWVEDLQPLIDGAVALVAPLRYGAGMKGKVTQSLGAGLPVVTTPTGAEGLGVTDGRELLIAEDAAGLAERIVRLHRDDALWGQLSQAGQDVVRRTASIELMRERLVELLAWSAGKAPADTAVASVPAQ